MSIKDKAAEAAGKAAVKSAMAINVHSGGHTYKDVASMIGNAYTALTGDNRGAAAGRVIDAATNDVTVDLDAGEIRRSS